MFPSLTERLSLLAYITGICFAQSACSTTVLIRALHAAWYKVWSNLDNCLHIPYPAGIHIYNFLDTALRSLNSSCSWILAKQNNQSLQVNSSHSVWSRKYGICPQRSTHWDLYNEQTWRMPVYCRGLQGQHHCGGEPKAAGQDTWGKPHSNNWLYLSSLPFHVGQTN